MRFAPRWFYIFDALYSYSFNLFGAFHCKLNQKILAALSLSHLSEGSADRPDRSTLAFEPAHRLVEPREFIAQQLFLLGQLSRLVLDLLVHLRNFILQCAFADRDGAKGGV